MVGEHEQGRASRVMPGALMLKQHFFPIFTRMIMVIYNPMKSPIQNPRAVVMGCGTLIQGLRPSGDEHLSEQHSER